MNNNNIYIFNQEIYKSVNNCGLPVGTAYFILKNICNELEKAYYQCVQEESKNIDSNEQSFNIEL